MGVTIRHATSEDGEQLLELWHGFTDHLSRFDERYLHNEEADDRWLRYFENQLVDSKYGTVLVADTGEELVGVLEARITGDHPIFRISDHGVINGHYVVSEYRGEGVGERLIEAAVEWFADSDRDLDFCRVDVLDGDERALSAYDEMSFEPVEHTYERSVEK
ncbi:MAG: N-acetyltransferase family protein [Salinirussus sp.]